MALTMRVNGLHHAISLGNIEASSEQIGSGQVEKCYDSDDENTMSRHRLRTSSSTELYPRTSVYSKGDIREQYCLTDRQLSTIEHPRRQRFFGCLSRRGAPQSFLGVCVGRRAPSDENLAAYAPFYKYPRYQHHYPQDGKAIESDMESSYFRRQPASILSTANKTSDAAGGNRYSWTDSHSQTNPDNNGMLANDQSIYGCAAHGNLPPAPPPPGPSTPRTKHVSFARSHTLTSFDDVNLGLRSSGRMTSTRSQERLIGGKKPIIASGSIYEPMQVLQNAAASQQTQLQQQQHQNILHHPHLHGHQHGHSHGHQHHIGQPFHVHQIVPIYHSELDTQLAMRRDSGMNMGVSMACHPPSMAPPSPEVVVVEKKFRNAMKTQATQTELRKEGHVPHLELSPRTIHKVRVVSQGAQTNGLLNGKKLTKSLSEMPNNQDAKDNTMDRSTDTLKSVLGEHDALHRTQSEEPPRSPHQSSRPNPENQYNVMYYNPPPPIEVSSHQAARRSSRISSIDSNQSYPPDDKIPPDSSLQSTTTHSDMKHEGSNQTFTSYQDSSANYEDSCGMGIFDYESNSLPRRACSYHRLDNDLYSNSLPRKDPIHSHEICRHITDCTELLGDSNITDFSRQHLLPPPRQYRKEEEVEEEPRMPRQMPQEENHYAAGNRRMSMVSTTHISDESPFKRDDIRRQSMPVSSRTDKVDDGYRRRPGIATAEFHSSEEKEIFIDFKPHISPKLTTKKHPRHRKVQKSVSDGEMLLVEQQQRCYKEDDSESNASIENPSTSNVESEVDEEDEEKEDPLYENVPSYSFLAPEIEKRNQFRKRSISLEDSGVKNENVIVKSAPPSPCQDEMLINTSTYPSSDSLANDLTRDHSDGIWNESQVTVLTADTRDLSEPDHGPGHLLTPSSKRKNLILQHQQRSSIDTDALDLEDQFTDHSPTVPSKGNFPTSGFALQPKSREFISTLAVPTNMVTPTIAVTPTSAIPEFDLPSTRRSPNNSRRSSKSLSPSTQDLAKTDLPLHQILPQKNADSQGSVNNYGYIRSDSAKWNTNNTTDISECSTNTDEYVTCTDTSKRTPGIKTPPTTTSSSSTTQVPVSAQSSQTEKTHGGSSFESASSLYSTRGDGLSEDNPQLDKEDNKLRSGKSDGTESAVEAAIGPKRSPSHSISSTSSGSYNMAAIQINVPPKLPVDEIAQATNTSSVQIAPATKSGLGLSTLEREKREKPKIHRESISDDERSDIRYSSSGYYESPHDDEHGTKLRRHRLEEDRKRRRTSMKLDIEKENLRALTSPIKKTQVASVTLPKDKSPEKQQANANIDASSPSKMKRFRPKIRRQLRRTSRDESTSRRPKTVAPLYGMQAPPLTSEKLLDCSLQENAAKPHETETKLQRTQTQTVADQIQNSPPPTSAPELTTTNPNTPAAEVFQLKAKSIESLRSVSPGSDSVFYSEADGTGGDPHSHCLHCGKEMEASNQAIGAVAGDSVESLPCIDNDNEQDIVKPPSDFADSPVTTKTTQRLYKKMDKRFRSEERYHAERGRHFKSRQENIRAKSEERGREKSTRSPQLLRPAGSSPCVLPDVNAEHRNQIIYRGHYDNSRYSRLTDADVWTQLDHQSFDRHRERRASTESEKSFHAKYQVILHRLVQRRCTLEMYHRQKNNIFQLISSNSSPESVRRKLEEVLKLMLMVWAREGQVLSKISQDKHGIDKTVVVKSDSGEFGFRIHGSKPVVVAAIEPDTPAESSGLEVGDIIISVNGVQVLDKHHTEVVKIAHAGCETLELEVARTIGVLMNEQQETPSKPVFSGYLWRQSGQAKGAPNAKKWVRRWFCLRPDHCLYYYKTEEDTQPVGAMIMAKHTVEQCPPEIGKPFAFKIDSGEGIPMYVAADSEELANQWMTILKRSTVNADPWLEKCARALHQPPSGISRPDCFGYLMKLGSRWCGWSKRYCVLKDACLYFYQDANSKNAFGMACLQGYKVASMSTNASGRKNSFEIIPQEPKLRHYYFSTESEMDKKRWISALEYSIDRWIKSG